MVNKKEIIGRPVIEDPDSGEKIELGQPIIIKKFEKESTQATLFVIKEALEEFYRRRSERKEREGEQDFQYMHNPMGPLSKSAKEIKEGGDLTIPLAILEAVRGEIQQEFEVLESLEPDAENQITEEKIEITRQADFEKEMHYQETSDVLFSNADYETPTRDNLLEFLRETKEMIKKLGKEDVEEEYGSSKSRDIVRKVFRSKMLTDVPAIERYETNRHIVGDYREIIGVINQRLLGCRDTIGDKLLRYANDPQEKFVTVIKLLLSETRKMELFLSQLEGERNERIAKER